DARQTPLLRRQRAGVFAKQTGGGEMTSPPKKRGAVETALLTRNPKPSKMSIQRPGDATARKGWCNVSWHASDAVWRMFDRKQNAGEFLMMLSMAHHYNEQRGRSFPGWQHQPRRSTAHDVGR